MSFKCLNECLNNSFLERIAVLEQMTESARLCLPEQLAIHCWVSGYEHGVLKLVSDNPLFATVIYHRQKDLLDRLNKEFGETLGVYFKKASIQVSHFPISLQTHR